MKKISCAVWLIILFNYIINVYADAGFFSENWEQLSFVPAARLIGVSTPSGPSDAEFTVHVLDTVNRVLSTAYGNNVCAWTRNVPDNSSTKLWSDERVIRHLSNVDITTLRMPGGAWADIWLWDGDDSHWALKGDLTSNTSYQNQFQSWSMTLDEELMVCEAIGAEPQIVVNYGLARFIDEENPVQKAAHYAAEWVRHVNIERGLNVRYWEIGNEDYGRWMECWEVDNDTITGTEYGRDFCVFADSMKAADPSIKIGAVLVADFKDDNVSIKPNWTTDVLNEVKDHADYVIIHQYFTYNDEDINNVTYEEVLAGRSVIGINKTDIDSITSAITGKNLPVAMTEYNMRAGHKNTTHVSTIFIAEAIGEFIKHGYGLVNVWDINNGASTDDHGMLARKDDETTDSKPYTEVQTGQFEEFDPHLYFFSYYYYRRYFGDIMVASEGGDESLHLYASTFSNGYLGLVLINESSESRTVDFTLDGFTNGDLLFYHAVTAEDLSSRIIDINGNAPPKGIVYGPRHYEDIPSYTFVIDSGSNEFIFYAKKYSVNFIAVKSGGSTSNIQVPATERGVHVLTSTLNDISFTLPEATNIRLSIFDVRGKMIKELACGTMESGTHSVALDKSHLSSGIYLCILEAGELDIKLKIKVMR